MKRLVAGSALLACALGAVACNLIFGIDSPDKIPASSSATSTPTSSSSGMGGSSSSSSSAGGSGGGTGGGPATDDMAYIKANKFDFTDGVAGPSVRAVINHPFWVDRHEVTVDRFEKWVDAGQHAPCNDGATACALDPTGAYPAMVWDPAWNADVANMTYSSVTLCDAADFATNPMPTWGMSNGAFPIVCVTWAQAVAFCAFEHKRVLTETEWQYVATGEGNHGVYPWGDSGVDCQHVTWKNAGDECGWPVAVGTAAQGVSDDMIFDLVGSVYEWGWDFAAPYPVSETMDYAGPASGTDRVTNGGSYARVDPDIQVHQRDQTSPGSTFADIGIRCAFTAN